MNELIEKILHRRTIRRFESRQIEEDALQQILQAGLYAPSAGGRQGPMLVVSQDRETNEQLGKIKRANSQPRMATGASYVSKEQPSIADDPHLKNAFYGAPTVITMFAPKKLSLFSRGLRCGCRKHDACGGCIGCWFLLHWTGLDGVCRSLWTGGPAQMGDSCRLLCCYAAFARISPGGRSASHPKTPQRGARFALLVR